MWRWAAKLFLQHPLLGVGTGGYQQATLDAGGDVGVAHPHNNVLYVAANYGLLGLAVFGWFFWVLLKYGWRHRQESAGFFVLAATLVILIGGATDTHILDAGGRALLSIATGFLASLTAGDGRTVSNGAGTPADS
jgi:O-antigen ligase